MSRKTVMFGVAALAALILLSLGVEASRASAGEYVPDPTAASSPVFVSREVVQPLPETPSAPADADIPATPTSLAALVEAMPEPATLSRELECLAGAIYFEARGEPQLGQLAVGRVVIERSRSGRFPATYCGVVHQPSQFSFISGGRMPAISRSSRAWREARAIALIADRDLWESPAEGALFFHARHVSPGWRLQRVAQVSTHVFYR